MTTPADKPPDRPATPQIIQGYGNGGFTTSGVRHNGSVIVLRDRTVSWLPPDDPSALDIADFNPILEAAQDVDIVLLGCGPRAAVLPPALRVALRDAGISIESMDTGAACRTFNLLQMEGRRVAAMLIAVP